MSRSPLHQDVLGPRADLSTFRFTFSGLANLHKPFAQGRRSTEFWREGVKILDSCKPLPSPARPRAAEFIS